MEPAKIIKKPVFSEKGLSEASKGKYTFEVDLSADKKKIAQAIQEGFSVDVKSVKTIIIKGRTVRKRGRVQERKKPPLKKAVVELAKGQKIPLFEGS